MKMKAAIQIGIILILALGSSAPRTLAQMWVPETPAKGLFGGATLGYGHSDVTDDWDDGSLSGRSTDTSEPVYKLFGGYQFCPYASVGGAYSYFGEFRLSATSDGSGNSWTAGSISGEQESDGWSLFFQGRLPISERWTFFGTIGWIWWESEERYNENGFVSSASESGDSLTVSGGFEFDHGLKDRIVYIFELGHQQVGDDDYNVITGSAGVIYRMP
ncbi:MAG: hypothetical protein K9M45_12795 [Kiritimatiellales bacterium]|nr:hypothetical protein [Kiritimatiellales bacterium]